MKHVRRMLLAHLENTLRGDGEGCQEDLEICGQEEAFVSLENAVRRKMSGGCCLRNKEQPGRGVMQPEGSFLST